MYLGSSMEHRTHGVLKLGLYEPGGCRPVHQLPRMFMPTSRDRRLLIELVEYWDSLDTADLMVRVFSDDLTLVR
jgi:hypothetical protein